MEDFTKKSYEERIDDIKKNLYCGGGEGQANTLLNVLMSSFSQREFTGHSDISTDAVLSNISQEMKHLKRIVRDGGIYPKKFFDSQFKHISQNRWYACIDNNLKFCVKQCGKDGWENVLYVFPYMNTMTAYDIVNKQDSIYQTDFSQ